MKLIQRIIALYLTIGICAAIFAQDSESAPELSHIEEITVVGSTTFAELRTRLEYAKLEVFNSYNDLNDDYYYDIECSFVAREGSHIVDRVCQPAFVAILEADAFQDQRQGFDTADLVQTDMEAETIAMEAHMTALAEQNPEFLKQTKEYMELSAEYERMKDEHCEGKIVCWLHADIGSE